ncbi:hypothetical protein J2Z83_002851 [Virgibacillus natechei]|uniref:Uncharacterized protein n=1 Tax=Virgibacillus natechei TaxID=1216297 RepID=A0ABS4IJG4_9BACI|nr:hypothetical protein [Virgibacillus natechei]
MNLLNINKFEIIDIADYHITDLLKGQPLFRKFFDTFDKSDKLNTLTMASC